MCTLRLHESYSCGGLDEYGTMEDVRKCTCSRLILSEKEIVRQRTEIKKSSRRCLMS